jgi:hypothetical protein
MKYFIHLLVSLSGRKGDNEINDHKKFPAKSPIPSQQTLNPSHPQYYSLSEDSIGCMPATEQMFRNLVGCQHPKINQ